jgi:hypothetical protein
MELVVLLTGSCRNPGSKCCDNNELIRSPFVASNHPQYRFPGTGRPQGGPAIRALHTQNSGTADQPMGVKTADISTTRALI